MKKKGKNRVGECVRVELEHDISFGLSAAACGQWLLDDGSVVNRRIGSLFIMTELAPRVSMEINSIFLSK